MLTELISRHQTIGHQILDLEAELGIDTEPHKERLDMLIEEARRAIQVKVEYTREDAVGILRTINSILQNNGFAHDDEKESIGRYLFYEGLGSKKIDCDNTSFIYLSIADALGLPLVAVNAPQHLFVRWLFDGNHLNWETTSAEEGTDSDYINYFHISPKSISNGVYLSSLTREQTISNAYSNRGDAWANKGSLDKAIEDYNKAIELNPNFAGAYGKRGDAWARKDSLDKAIVDYDEAIGLDPNLAGVYSNRGNAWYRKGKLDEAIKDYNKAIRLNPNLSEAFIYRGDAWADKGNLDSAIADYDEAIRLNPDFAEAYNNRGNLWFSKGSLDKAIADYDRAIGLNPNFAAAYNNRGNLWFSKGSLDKAIEDYNKAIGLNPNFAVAYNNRGNARLRQHQYIGAFLDFARAKLPILR